MTADRHTSPLLDLGRDIVDCEQLAWGVRRKCATTEPESPPRLIGDWGVGVLIGDGPHRNPGIIPADGNPGS